MITPPSPEPDTMTPPILNLSGVALQSRPPEFQPPEAIAEVIAAAPFRSVSRSGQQLDCWDSE